ncbi:MAG: hypothetical protein ACM3MH_10755 [Actinomycetota bacterium]
MRGFRIKILVFATLFPASLQWFSATPASADCQVISATYGANRQGEALSSAQALAARSANALKAQKHWHSITMKAQQVKPDPFFKTVRPEVSTDLIVGSYVTARTYTTCWTGVTVPFVCTSGSQVCGK